jgi:GNAT superfamily N-acetyltransferase
MSPGLRTGRLRLERFSGDSSSEDAFMLGLLNEPSFLRHIGDRGVRDLDGARQYLQMGPIASYQRHGFGLDKIVLESSGECIGVCGLVKRDALPDPDLGYALLPAFWGHGYAAEAAAEVLGHAREGLGFGRILAITDPANAASIGLLRRLGFVFERMVRMPADDIPLQLFASTPTDAKL